MKNIKFDRGLLNVLSRAIWPLESAYSSDAIVHVVVDINGRIVSNLLPEKMDSEGKPLS